MSSQPNEHSTQFDLFLASIEDMSPKLLKTQANFTVLRNAALHAYALQNVPTTVITAEQLSVVYLSCRKHLKYHEEPAPPPKPDYGLTADGRPRLTGRRSSMMSQTEKDEESRRIEQKHKDVQREIQYSKDRQAERALRYAEENVTYIIESGPNSGRVDHGKSDEARRAARAKWAAIDKQRGATNG